MEIKLNLNNEYGMVRLYQLLYNEKASCIKENHKHTDMIELLIGNDNNEKAKRRLEHEKHCMRINNEKLGFLDSLINQLKPLVDSYFTSK